MGYYINPFTNISKEKWLDEYAEQVSRNEMIWEKIPEGHLPIILINNGEFTAAGIGYSEQELKTFLEPDGRERKYFVAKISDISNASSGGFLALCKKEGWIKTKGFPKKEHKENS